MVDRSLSINTKYCKKNHFRFLIYAIILRSRAKILCDRVSPCMSKRMLKRVMHLPTGASIARSFCLQRSTIYNVIISWIIIE